MERYLLICEVARGGTAIVYKAYDKKMQKVVALKCSTQRMVLLKEYQFLKKIDCTGIPKVYDFFCEDDKYIIVMEYIYGQTLETVMTDNNVQWQTVVETLIRVCKIILFLHEEEKVCYLDLKPSNVIVTEKNIYLIDFGSIQYFREFNSEESITVYGTQKYAAPELYLPTHSFGRHCDIYQIGCLLEEIMKIKSVKNKEISAIIRRCKNVIVSKRYATVEEIVNLLYVCIQYKGVIYRKKVQ